ncbi:Na+/H+ antiporter subunit E [Streptomyces sp. SM14]|uniref:Na+/H+ antiporter subunit E n=1 Tax=Streptomyces sp. SM14 TaxID=1736045 RepID=UPI000CD5A9A1|nr:Na+/H+ antiporter subunit E [Streptomyces sp. SM14]
MIDMLRRIAVRSYRIGRFIGYFVYELIASNVIVAWEIITPRSGLSPVIIAMPLRSRTRGERTLFVGVVTLTPGTLSLDLRDEPGTVYIHGMHARDVDRFRTRLHYLEDLLLAAWRPVGPSGQAGPALDRGATAAGRPSGGMSVPSLPPAPETPSADDGNGSADGDSGTNGNAPSTEEGRR